jgi:hypothetical protein
MPADPADSRVFFERARLEAERYGEDEWVFLRELVQNARDARATRIAFETGASGGDEFLVCRDNGDGMTPDAVDRFLLRLYASSKEDDRDTIGFFGVGFWSVLLFAPREIRVLTRSGGVATAFVIDCAARSIRPLPAPAETEPGTVITLIRPVPPGADPGGLGAVVRAQLDRYTGHVRPLPGVRMLELSCDGERINRGFDLPIRLGRRFRSRRYDGVLGFGPVPSVRIYKGGILARETAGLDEVIPSRPVRLPRSGWGLFPVVAINIDGLRLLMDRHTICEDPLLHEAVRFCERELLRIHRRLLGRLFPLDWRNGLASFWARGRAHVLRLAAGLAAAAVVAAALWWAAGRLPAGWRAAPGTGPAPGMGVVAPLRTVDTLFVGWDGAWTDRPGPTALRWDFHYRGPDGLLFQAGVLDRFEPRRGPAPGPLRLAGPYPDIAGDRAGESPVSVQLGVSGGSVRFTLPLPVGHVLESRSLRLDGEPLPPLGRDAFGAPVVAAGRAGRLEYRTQPGAIPPAPPEPLAPAAGTWPAGAAAALREAARLDEPLRVPFLTAWTIDHVAYTRVPSVAAPAHDTEGWLAQALRAGAGDCDVVNGTLAMMLQGAGVPAHLRIGLVGEGGGARPELHAWAAYWRDGWHMLDLTRAEPSSLGVPASRPSTVRAGESAVRSGGKALFSTRSYRTAALLGAAVLLVSLLAGIVWRRLARPRLDEPQFIRDIFEHYFTYGSAHDPLRLRYRPVLPTLGGRMLSLHQAQRLADRGRLLGAHPNCPLLPGLNGRGNTLDRSAPVVSLLEPFLPPVTWLEDVAAILAAPPLHPALRQAESRIRRRDPLFRLHQIPGAAIFQEVYLPFRDRTAGRRHVVVGEGHPVFHAMRRDFDAAPGEGARRAAGRLLAKTTFYAGERDLGTPIAPVGE